ncbi:MAG: hypothetical protein FWH22_02665 [Fibromonadales bacterium]|nr:hypothetical protein [Fibromonadales bacterium]
MFKRAYITPFEPLPEALGIRAKPIAKISQFHPLSEPEFSEFTVLPETYRSPSTNALPSVCYTYFPEYSHKLKEALFCKILLF